MRASSLVRFGSATMIAWWVANMSACSDECSGKNQGAAGCSCSFDQDCATGDGAVLLCEDGVCTAGDPPNAVPDEDKCETDADCGSERICGPVEDVCLAVPSCQRLEVELSIAGQGTLTPLQSSVVDCVHTWRDGEALLDAKVRIDLEGVITDEGGAQACSGVWSAGDRLGALRCGDTEWAVGPRDALERACADDAGSGPLPSCNGCTLIGTRVGVCR